MSPRRTTASYNPRDLALIRRTVAVDTTDDEFALFIYWARSLRLDPLRRQVSDPEHADALHRRYCDFWLVDGELELNAARFSRPAKRPARKLPTAPEDLANPVPAETPPKRVSRAKPKAPAAD